MAPLLERQRRADQAAAADDADEALREAMGSEFSDYAHSNKENITPVGFPPLSQRASGMAVEEPAAGMVGAGLGAAPVAVAMGAGEAMPGAGTADAAEAAAAAAVVAAATALAAAAAAATPTAGVTTPVPVLQQLAGGSVLMGDTPSPVLDPALLLHSIYPTFPEDEEHAATLQLPRTIFGRNVTVTTYGPQPPVSPPAPPASDTEIMGGRDAGGATMAVVGAAPDAADPAAAGPAATAPSSSPAATPSAVPEASPAAPTAATAPPATAAHGAAAGSGGAEHGAAAVTAPAGIAGAPAGAHQAVPTAPPPESTSAVKQQGAGAVRSPMRAPASPRTLEEGRIHFLFRPKV